MLPTLVRYRFLANYAARLSRQAYGTSRAPLSTASLSATQKSLASTLPQDDQQEKKPKTESRWRRLKRERKQAPPPKNRSTYRFERDALYSVEEALTHVRKSAWADFDESLELVFRLNVDPRRADHNLRGTFSLPFGTGRADKVAVFVADVNGHDAQVATHAGAHLVGADDLIDQVVKTRGKVLNDFATCVAMSEMVSTMARKVGRILGPKGLMPSPKMGTVINNEDALKQLIANVLKGIVMYRVDKTSNMHLNVGKLSFSDDMLAENVLAATRAIYDIRPSNVKKAYIHKAVVCSTMGPSVGLALDKLVPRVLQAEAQ